MIIIPIGIFRHQSAVPRYRWLCNTIRKNTSWWLWLKSTTLNANWAYYITKRHRTMLFVDAGFTTIICMLGYILIHALSSDVCIYKSAITIQRTISPWKIRRENMGKASNPQTSWQRVAPARHVQSHFEVALLQSLSLIYHSIQVDKIRLKYGHERFSPLRWQ